MEHEINIRDLQSAMDLLAENCIADGEEKGSGLTAGAARAARNLVANLSPSASFSSAAMHDVFGRLCQIYADSVQSITSNDSKSVQIASSIIYYLLDIFSDKPLVLAAFYMQMSGFFTKQGKYMEALEFGGRALLLRMKILGLLSDKTAESHYNLGLLYRLLGNVEQSRKELWICRGIRKQIFGPDSLPVANCDISIGQTEKRGSCFADSYQAFVRGYRVRLKLLGPSHPQVLAAKELMTRAKNMDGKRFISSYELQERIAELQWGLLDSASTQYSVSLFVGRLGTTNGTATWQGHTHSQSPGTLVAQSQATEEGCALTLPELRSLVSAAVRYAHRLSHSSSPDRSGQSSPIKTSNHTNIRNDVDALVGLLLIPASAGSGATVPSISNPNSTLSMSMGAAILPMATFPASPSKNAAADEVEKAVLTRIAPPPPQSLEDRGSAAGETFSVPVRASLWSPKVATVGSETISSLTMTMTLTDASASAALPDLQQAVATATGDVNVLAGENARTAAAVVPIIGGNASDMRDLGQSSSIPPRPSRGKEELRASVAFLATVATPPGVTVAKASLAAAAAAAAALGDGSGGGRSGSDKGRISTSSPGPGKATTHNAKQKSNRKSMSPPPFPSPPSSSPSPSNSPSSSLSPSPILSPLMAPEEAEAGLLSVGDASRKTSKTQQPQAQGKASSPAKGKVSITVEEPEPAAFRRTATGNEVLEGGGPMKSDRVSKRLSYSEYVNQFGRGKISASSFGADEFEEAVLPFALGSRGSVLMRDKDGVYVIARKAEVSPSLRPTSVSKSTVPATNTEKSRTASKSTVPPLPPPLPTSWPPVAVSIAKCAADILAGIFPRESDDNVLHTHDGDAGTQGSEVVLDKAATAHAMKQIQLDTMSKQQLQGTIWEETPHVDQMVPWNELFPDLEAEFSRTDTRKAKAAAAAKAKAGPGGMAGFAPGKNPLMAALSAALVSKKQDEGEDAPPTTAGASFIDKARGQNLSIMLAKFGRRPFSDITEAIENFDAEALGLAAVQSLTQFLPTEAERAAIKKLLDNTEQQSDNRTPTTRPSKKQLPASLQGLGRPELFLIEISSVANLEDRLEALAAALTAQETHDNITNSAKAMLKAVTQVRSSSRLKYLLSAILQLTNLLQGHTAAGFRLRSLQKLSQTKCNSGETADQYLVNRIFEYLPDALELRADMPSLEEARTIVFPRLVLGVRKLQDGIAVMKKLRLDGEAKDTDREDQEDLLTRYFEEVSRLLSRANEKLQEAQQDFNDLCVYLGESPAAAEPELIFGSLLSFIRNVEAHTKAAEEKARRLNRNKK